VFVISNRKPIKLPVSKSIGGEKSPEREPFTLEISPCGRDDMGAINDRMLSLPEIASLRKDEQAIMNNQILNKTQITIIKKQTSSSYDNLVLNLKLPQKSEFPFMSLKSFRAYKSVIPEMKSKTDCILK